MNSEKSLNEQRGSLWALLLVTTMSLYLPGAAAALEKPEYEVLYEDDDVEYRRYLPYIVAETEMTSIADYNDAANEGFRRLFDYISGDNNNQAEIAMTAPVQQTPRASSGDEIAMTAPVQQSETESGWRVSFMLPSEYTMDSAPRPTDERVYLRQVQPRLMAVLRYSGRWTESNFEKYRSRLLARLEAQGIEVNSAAESAVYNPPFMPPFMRHNEIMVEVDSVPQAMNALAGNE